jgi:Tubulin-tyrosine ligase family
VNNIWLVKPANANQGRGIEIFNDLEEMTSFINSRPQFTCCVVQKYIERPLLFKARKFDIRVWALVNCRSEVYMYRHGYLRTSSDDYNLTNGNNYVHLTNNCLQKYGDNYGVHEDGNTVGYEVLQAYLDENFPEYHLSVERDFLPRMKDLVIDTIQATKV